MKNKHIYQDWLLLTQTVDSPIAIACFKEIENQYSLPERHYHTMYHVQDLLLQIRSLPITKTQKEILAYAALFHDVIYIPGAKDNEIKSANFAVTWLEKLHVSKPHIDTVYQLIIATYNHISDDPLIQLFLDMDLSILGSSPKVYTQYYTSIRNEYSKIPLQRYTIGRKYFLQQALDRDRIFNTVQYHTMYEQQARINIQEELNAL